MLNICQRYFGYCKGIIQFDMIQSFKMAFDTNRISTQKIREIIEELTELGVYDSKTGMVSYDNDDKVLEQKIIAIRSHIVQKHWLLFLGQTCAKGLTYRPFAQVCPFYFTCIFHNFFVYLRHNQRFNNNINFS